MISRLSATQERRPDTQSAVLALTPPNPTTKTPKSESTKTVTLDLLAKAGEPLPAKEIAKRVIESGRCASLKARPRGDDQRHARRRLETRRPVQAGRQGHLHPRRLPPAGTIAPAPEATDEQASAAKREPRTRQNEGECERGDQLTI